MKRLLIHWFLVALGLGVADWLIGGVRITSPVAHVVAALVVGFINAVVRPILVVLTLPLTVVTLGLFYLVVNGIAFALAAWLVPGFGVDSLWSAILGALVLSLISWFVGGFLGERSESRHQN